MFSSALAGGSKDRTPRSLKKKRKLQNYGTWLSLVAKTVSVAYYTVYLDRAEGLALATRMKTYTGWIFQLSVHSIPA